MKSILTGILGAIGFLFCGFIALVVLGVGFFVLKYKEKNCFLGHKWVYGRTVENNELRICRKCNKKQIRIYVDNKETWMDSRVARHNLGVN